ncbi:MAG: Hsp70 family protein, partial [Pirellulaceae bacterium]|nr:Hsp70 family protein [Pirellulaceae bacterium]
LLERTAYTTRQLLKTAAMEWKDVSRVLLVGGSTRMPMVVRMLRGLSGIKPDHTVNPDEAVARGAALYAAYLLGKESGGVAGAALKISNVNSHSLGIEGIDPETMRKKNVVLIPRNTKLPAKFKERFATRRENQRSIAIQILEGESASPQECSAIGRTVVRDLPDGLPKNWPVEVTFEYAENGRLTVSAIVPGTHQGTTLDLERALGVSGDWVARWKRPIEEAAGFDQFESLVQEVMDESDPGSAEPLSSEEVESMQADFGEPPGEPSQPGGWTPFVAGPRTHDPEPEMPEDADESWEIDVSHRIRSAPMQSLPRWVGMVGHVIAAALGLTLGYLILCWLRPETFPFPWNLY